jgi:four helix bundle protein
MSILVVVISSDNHYSMFLNLSHTKTEVFQQSKQLVLDCYQIIRMFPIEEKFSLTQQIKRAALSVHVNIAEGCSRKSVSERKRFYEVARGSVIEVDTAIDIACKLNYCKQEHLKQLGQSIVSTFKQLSALIAFQPTV